MSEAYVIEVWGDAVGIAVKDGDSFRFHASAPSYFALDGKHFRTVGHAHLAAIDHARIRAATDRTDTSAPSATEPGRFIRRPPVRAAEERSVGSTITFRRSIP